MDPGGRVLAPKPSYPLFDYLSELNDIHLEKYPLFYNDGWRFDPAQIECLSKKPFSAVILVNPNNPTGNYVSESEKETLNRLCGVFDSAVIADEVFLDFAWEDGAKPSFAGNEDVLTFTLGGISKMLGLPQMKVSWIVVSGPKALKDEALQKLEIISYTYLSVNTPSQRALPFWFSRRRKIIEEIRDRVLSNYRYLSEKWEGKTAGRLLRTEGGWQAILQFESPLIDEELALELLNKKNILVHPGYFFDFPEGDFLVLSLLPELAHFQNGIQSLNEL